MNVVIRAVTTARGGLWRPVSRGRGADSVAADIPTGASALGCTLALNGVRLLLVAIGAAETVFPISMIIGGILEVLLFVVLLQIVIGHCYGSMLAELLVRDT